MRVAIAAAVASASLVLSGCSALERGAEDASVVATYPVHAVTNSIGRMQDRYRDDPRAAIVLSPFLVPLYMFEDTLFTGVSAADGALTPFYAPFEMRPLGLYDCSGVLPALRREEVRQCEEDVLLAMTYPAYLFAWFGCFLEGRAPSQESWTCPSNRAWGR